MLRKALSALLFLFFAANAFAFGVEPGTHNLGSEHEKITRAAVKDLEPKTLSQLSGSGEDPGAVGVPDTADRGLLKHVEAHCDGGDYLDRSGKPGAYGQTADAAQGALTACRQYIIQRLDDAVAWAGALVKADEQAVAIPCTFNGKQTAAKCNVLEQLGLAFHASQDFYARTNWVDRPAKGQLSAKNPPGLEQSGRAKWLDPRLSEPFPEGLISGCPGDLHVLGITFGCEYGLLPPLVGKIRVMRDDLAKDNGPIGSGAGGIGTSPRGRINGNFSRAVAAAIEDTADKWAYFKEQVVTRFGKSRGNRVLCLLQHDQFDPKACAEAVAQDKTCAEREVAMSDSDSGDAYVPQFTATDAESKTAETLYEDLRQYCVIEETDITRNNVINGGTSEAGRTNARTSAIRSLALWSACPVELARHLPDMTKAAKDNYQTQISKPGSDPKNEQALLTRIYATCILGAHQQRQGK